jgi:glycosyltransferase involved in cell wall biosynthesis
MKKLGLAGQRRVEAEFRWDRIAERMEDVYDKSLRLFSSATSTE